MEAHRVVRRRGSQIWVDRKAIVLLEILGKVKIKSNYIGNRTRYLPVCSIVLQSITLPRGLSFCYAKYRIWYLCCHCQLHFSYSRRIVSPYRKIMPVAVTVRSKAWTVFAHSNTGIMGSNPTQDVDVFLRLFCVYVLCVGSGLATGWSPVQRGQPTGYRLRNWT
jgi:hypothetical protein